MNDNEIIVYSEALRRLQERNLDQDTYRLIDVITNTYKKLQNKYNQLQEEIVILLKENEELKQEIKRISKEIKELLNEVIFKLGI